MEPMDFYAPDDPWTYYWALDFKEASADGLTRTVDVHLIRNTGDSDFMPREVATVPMKIVGRTPKVVFGEVEVEFIMSVHGEFRIIFRRPGPNVTRMIKSALDPLCCPMGAREYIYWDGIGEPEFVFDGKKVVRFYRIETLAEDRYKLHGILICFCHSSKEFRVIDFNYRVGDPKRALLHHHDIIRIETTESGNIRVFSETQQALLRKTRFPDIAAPGSGCSFTFRARARHVKRSEHSPLAVNPFGVAHHISLCAKRPREE